MTNEWFILPSTMSLYKKRTVDLTTANSHWSDGCILVCKTSVYRGEDRFAFVHASGAFEQHENAVGKTFTAYHDQTGVLKGPYKVLNVVSFKDKQIESQVNDIGLAVKASLAVLK